MDIGELLKVFITSQDKKSENTQTIPQEVINQYPYGEFPIQYTKSGQEQIRKSSENRFSYNETPPAQSEDKNFDIMSLLPLVTLMSNKKQPKDMFELLSTFLFKDKPELKKIFELFPKHNGPDIKSEEPFPDTNKVSINSLKRIN